MEVQNFELWHMCLQYVGTVWDSWILGCLVQTLTRSVFPGPVQSQPYHSFLVLIQSKITWSFFKWGSFFSSFSINIPKTSPVFHKDPHIYSEVHFQYIDLRGSRICVYIKILLKNKRISSSIHWKKIFLLESEIVAQVKSVHETERSDKNCPMPVPWSRFVNWNTCVCVQELHVHSWSDYFLCWSDI